jgi:hypothetical protein
MEVAMRCPACSSEDVRRLSAVWEEGSYSETTVSRTRSKSTSNVWGGGQMGAVQHRQTGTTHSTTTGRSALAERARPPERAAPFLFAVRTLGVGAVAIFFGGVVIAVATSDPVAFSVMTLASVLLVAYVINAVRTGLAFNRSEYPGLREQWEHSWWCSRCGEIYQHG